MKRTMTLAALCAALTTATAAQAEVHTILILPDSYYPVTTYIDEGDTVIFENASGSAHTMLAKDGSWEVGPIAQSATHSMIVPKNFTKTFYNKDITNEGGEYLVQGKMSFAPPPLD